MADVNPIEATGDMHSPAPKGPTEGSRSEHTRQQSSPLLPILSLPFQVAGRKDPDYVG